KVRALGVSAHNDPAGVLRGAVASGVYSMAMVAYNITNRRYGEAARQGAQQKAFGVVAMKVAQAMYQPDRSPSPYPERLALLDRMVPGELNPHHNAYTSGLSNPHLSAAMSNTA